MPSRGTLASIFIRILMRHFFAQTIGILITILFPAVLLGQIINIDSCGLDSNAILNNHEIAYFNYHLGKKHDFDFRNKKVAFTYGNFGKGVISKKDYFERWGREYYKLKSHVVDIPIILTDQEKIQSGGFDIIIVSWSKILPTGKSRQKLIKRVNKKLKSTPSHPPPPHTFPQ